MNRKKPLLSSTMYKWCGHVSLGLGILGVVLPLLPTTPFILLASACYLRGDPTLHQKLREHPQFGPLLLAWEEGKGIPLKIKILAITMLWTFLLISIVFVVPVDFVKILLGSIGVGVSFYLIFRVPTLKD